MQRGSCPDDVHHTMGSLQIHDGTTRLHCLRNGYMRRFDEIASDVPNNTKGIDDSIVGRLDHCSITPGGGMATVVRKQWNNVEPEEICIRAE